MRPMHFTVTLMGGKTIDLCEWAIKSKTDAIAAVHAQYRFKPTIVNITKN